MSNPSSEFCDANPPVTIRQHQAAHRICAAGVAARHFAKTKKHSARQLKKLADGLNRTGFSVPILVDDDRDIVSGHARAEAAKMIGLETVPIIRISHLSRDELRLFAIFENKIASEGIIDLDAVRLELDDLVVSSSDVVLTDSGFEVAEIDAMNGLTRTNELDDLDEDPELPATPVTRLGDLWQLGPHRVVCGDCTDAAVLGRLMNGAAASAAISDAP